MRDGKWSGGEVAVSREQWRKTLLAAMANYIDSGSIVAGAVALPLWTKQFHFGSHLVSLLGAFSSNAISAGLGALIGGHICGRLGRKEDLPVGSAAVCLRGPVDHLRPARARDDAGRDHGTRPRRRLPSPGRPSTGSTR